MLLLVFLMLLLGLFALFLGGGLVAQGYLYQQPADRLPVRSAGAALLVASFITFWVWVDKHAPEKYDTLFNFRGETSTEFDEFEAVRWAAANGKLKLDPSGKPIESVVKFKRAAGAKGAFVEEKTGAPFELRGYAEGGSGQYMVGAIRVKGPNDAEPVRYNAKLKDDKSYPLELRFEEEKGSRYVPAIQKNNHVGALHVPSAATVFVALLLNFLLVAVWVVAFWPIMRFSLGHSLMFTAVLAVVVMLALMPVLFKQNRVPPPLAPATHPPASAAPQ